MGRLRMIGAIDGTILLKKSDSLIIMAGSIGYTVFITHTTHSLLETHAKILLYTYTHVREDILQLFGFKTPQELELFELLLTVSGIGPKTALLIMDRGVEHIVKAVGEADVAFFTGIPRLGSKNSQKVIIELKSKIGNGKDLDLKELTGETHELMEALLAIGFSKNEIMSVVKKLPDEAKTIEQKIRISLKMLGKRV